MNFTEAATKLAGEPLLGPDWKAPVLAIWLRDGFRCAYCHRDMLESRSTCYDFYAHDHILPKARYPQHETAEWNIALACRRCNSLKATQDFSTADERAAADPSIYRGVWIQRVRDQLRPKIAELDALFEKQRALIRSSLAQAKAAGSA